MRLDNETVDDLLPLAADLPLLQSLTEGVNVDLALEPRMAAARRLLLEAYRLGHPRLPALRPLCLALAHQGFNNEYIMATRGDEMARVPVPEANLSELPAAVPPSFEWAVIVAAMYRPLSRTLAGGPHAVALERFSGDLRPLIQRTLLEPAKEAMIAGAMPSLGDPEDETSVAVRGVYERHPYPRWFQVRPSGKSIHDEIDGFFPDRHVVGAPQILVAGCGTGHHAIRVALDNPSADVVGLDFSRAALAYGARKASELGVRNVSFVHGDVLDVDRLGRQFHHIECSGVLHHIRERDRAWSRLVASLRPGGTLKVGVYSGVARLHIAHLRRLFPLGSDADSQAVAALRARILTTPSLDAIRMQLARHRDFFATSTVRDLLFHVYERPYSVRDIEAVVATCNLRLLGVHVPREIVSAIRAREPNADWPVATFDRWKAIEWAYAGTAAMFRFWLWKPD